MFDLEKAIAEWRRQMHAAGLETPSTLEELEIHLREDIHVLLAAGEPEPQALQLAVARLGKPAPLRREFDKLKRPPCRPATIGYWLYAAAMILMAVVVAAPKRQLFGASKMGLFPNPLLLSAHVFSLTAGYCAAFLAGSYGTFYVCYRFFHALTPVRQQSLGRAVGMFTRLAGGMVILGMMLGVPVSKQCFGAYWRWDPREIGALCVVFWFIALVATPCFGVISERGTMLVCIGGNVIVALAWFGAGMMVHHPHALGYGMGDFWPLAVFVGIQFCFFVMGVAPVQAEKEG